MSACDRICKNVKLSWESIVVISSEIVKVVTYWVLITADTKEIYEKIKEWVTDFKKKLWK